MVWQKLFQHAKLSDRRKGQGRELSALENEKFQKKCLKMLYLYKKKTLKWQNQRLPLKGTFEENSLTFQNCTFLRFLEQL